MEATEDGRSPAHMMHGNDTPPNRPTLVASTAGTYCCSISESWDREERVQDEAQRDSESVEPESGARSAEDNEVNYFKSAQWSADGTSLITSSADNRIRTFILPPTLLDKATAPLVLSPYTTHTIPTPTSCVAVYPHFTLSEATSTIYLSAPHDLPIRLQNVLTPAPGNTPLATYKLICPTTEAYLQPASLLWVTPGTHFLTGTDSLIARFDVERSGEGPVTRMPTIPSKRHKMKGGGVGMRGILSTLSLQPSESGDGMLAAGSWTRWVGLYDAGGMGGTVATWSIAGAADGESGIGGAGVSQTAWSACGRYLVVAERMSRGVLVFDVRVTGKMVCWLEDRAALTNQRLSVDVFAGGPDTGVEVWAGGTDGLVRVWENVGMTEGAVQRSWDWSAHDDPVTSTIVHNSGTVVATSSGQRAAFTVGDESGSDSESESESKSDDEGDSDSDSNEDTQTSDSEDYRRIPDNSIKVWAM
ncbi:WD repeat domain-containing protein [Phlyctema vagabunda]|uniref:WD repeat domain-containing protein n=1 Tax=Phlyctema vagabunda TaxID=108571 RepID=A0ABR4P5M9_9HELO